jgi:hypothetical protein
MGWRYFSEQITEYPSPHRAIVDVAVDRDWRLARLRIQAGDHELLLEPTGPDLLTGFRDRRPIEVPYGPGYHVDYLTPATNAITVRRSAGATAPLELDVVFIEPLTLVPRAVRQRYGPGATATVETAAGRFEATRWEYRSLEDGWTGELWVAGDVVVAYPEVFVLETYDPGASGPRVVG